MRLRVCAGVVAGVLVGAGVCVAQVVGSVMLVDPPPVPTMAGGVSLGMTPGGMVPGVKGMPYSAKETTTTVRHLEDGTTMTTVREERWSRDSEGRQRIENYRMVDGKPELWLVTIIDHVAGRNIMLVPHSKTARVTETAVAKPLTPEQQTQRAAMLEKAKAAREARIAAGTEVQTAASTPEREKLGSQDIAGVYAEGTRNTLVIPAGHEGNDREIRVVTETWYAPDLKISVGRTTDDPRTGKSTMVVSDLERGQPDVALFQVPPDYKVEESKPLGPGVP